MYLLCAPLHLKQRSLQCFPLTSSITASATCYDAPVSIINEDYNHLIITSRTNHINEYSLIQ